MVADAVDKRRAECVSGEFGPSAGCETDSWDVGRRRAARTSDRCPRPSTGDPFVHARGEDPGAGSALVYCSGRKTVFFLYLPSLYVGFYRAMLCIRGTSHVSVSVRVCPSVTSRSSTKSAKRRITQTTPHDTLGSLAF